MRAHHKTFWTLSPPTLQFKVSKEKFTFQIFWYQFNSATIESPIRIVAHLPLVKKEQCLRCNSNQFGLENLAEGIVIIMIILELIV